jgi:hypothetical protein
MQVVTYESANRTSGSMPVHFLRPDGGELERVVEVTENGLRIDPRAYSGIVPQFEELDRAQVHYLLLNNGSLYRVFVGRSPADRLRYGVLKSAVRIGSVSDSCFAQLVPETHNLSESQINRAIRKLLRNEQQQLKTSN